MEKELIDKLAKWFKEGSDETKREIRKYVYSLDIRNKDEVWEKIVRIAMRDWSK